MAKPILLSVDDDGDVLRTIRDLSVASLQMLGEGVVAYGYDSRCGMSATCDYASAAAGQRHISVGEYVNQQECQGSDSDS